MSGDAPPAEGLTACASVLGFVFVVVPVVMCMSGSDLEADCLLSRVLVGVACASLLCFVCVVDIEIQASLTAASSGCDDSSSSSSSTSSAGSCGEGNGMSACMYLQSVHVVTFMSCDTPETGGLIDVC